MNAKRALNVIVFSLVGIGIGLFVYNKFMSKPGGTAAPAQAPEVSPTPPIRGSAATL